MAHTLEEIAHTIPAFEANTPESLPALPKTFDHEAFEAGLADYTRQITPEQAEGLRANTIVAKTNGSGDDLFPTLRN